MLITIQKLSVRNESVSRFEMKDLGKAQKVLGMRSRQEKVVVKLDQVNCVNDILSRFKLTDCKAVSSPVSTAQRLVEPERKLYTTRECSIPRVCRMRGVLGSRYKATHNTCI